MLDSEKNFLERAFETEGEGVVPPSRCSVHALDVLMPASNSDAGRCEMELGGPGGYREDLGRVAIPNALDTVNSMCSMVRVELEFRESRLDPE